MTATRRLFSRRVRVPEKAEQQHGVQLLRSIGAKVYVLGGHRRAGDYQGTMQTEGIADVFAFVPVRGEPRRIFLAWECKAAGGRLRPEQLEFEALCASADVAHVVGPFDALIAWLVLRGFVKAESFPTYRQQPRSAL